MPLAATGQTESEHSHAEIFFDHIRIFRPRQRKLSFESRGLFAIRDQVFLIEEGIEQKRSWQEGQGVEWLKNHLARKRAIRRRSKLTSSSSHARRNRCANSKGAVTFC